jgi:hypothetical protein
MAFLEPYIELPPDNILVNCRFTQYPGLLLECLFDSANQLLTVVASGLIIPAYQLVEWELI